MLIKKICGLLVGHSCYDNGILLRLCIANNIKTFEATTEYMFAHNKRTIILLKIGIIHFKKIKKLKSVEKKKS